MVLLPEERGMTLAELRQIAARQQHQIDAQQQLLVAKEQRLKFLKQQEARHHNLSERQLDANCLLNLRDKVETQELKLRQLRALRGQVEQQKTNNSNLGTELDSIRALFCEKEKELDLAVNKVEELSRQLDEIKKNNRKNYLISTSELESLRRELLYRTKLSEQQNNYICQQREKITNRQQDIAALDKKINELNARLHRKRILNEQFATQIHLASLSRNSNCLNLNSDILVKIESRAQEILEKDHTQDDLAANLHAHKYDFGEFSLTKNDPKYQTLPYNTKFTLKEKQLEDSLSSSTEDESWSSKSEASSDLKSGKPFSNMCNFSPRPFNNNFNGNSGVQKVTLQITNEDNQLIAQKDEDLSNENIGNKNNSVNEIFSPINNTQEVQLSSSEVNKPSIQKPHPKTLKPAVPPKPALSVKPMLMNRDNNIHRKKTPPEADVSMALTVLKNKSSEKEKSDASNYRERLLYYQCIPRYSNSRHSSQDPLLPKSRILTYFSKTLLQPEGNVHDQNEKTDQSDIPKRKPTFVQLPIKPKPLTIRKNPGIEPPKLKLQSTAASAALRKVTESPLKQSKSSLLTQADDTPSEFVSKNLMEDVSVEALPPKLENEEIQEKSEPKDDVDSNDFNTESLEVKNEENETACNEADYLSDQNEVDSYHSNLTLQQIKKGNLKAEGSSRVSRRVSFDPLALLLDAALEGELELVKKIASEVVNPSAANDEGITALHNAICAGQFEVVKFLIEFGCDVNAQDSDGWTPLHCAASCNNLPMVKFLVERGACIFATTLSDQETAAEKCEEDGAGFDGCSEYLFSLQDNLGVVNNGVVYAVYDYDVQNADELSFQNGDMLTVLRRSDDEENEWWWCRLNDEEGYVPRNLLGLYPRVNSPNVSKTS